MPTYRLGSFIINSRVLSLSTRGSTRSWKSGAFSCVNLPIAENIPCRPGLWWSVNWRGTRDNHYALINFDNAYASCLTPFSIHRKIATFQNLGTIQAKDVAYPGLGITSHKFQMNPGKYHLVSYADQFTENDSVLFLFRPKLSSSSLSDEIYSIQKDIHNMIFNPRKI